MGDKACEVYSAAQENGLFLSVSYGAALAPYRGLSAVAL